MEDHVVETFMEITSCNSEAAAVQLLASCSWDLDEAINCYFAFDARAAAVPAPATATGNSGAAAPPPAATEDAVRAPIPARSDMLYGSMYGPSRRAAPSVWEERTPSPRSGSSVAPVQIEMPSATSLTKIEPNGWGDSGREGEEKLGSRLVSDSAEKELKEENQGAEEPEPEHGSKKEENEEHEEGRYDDDGMESYKGSDEDEWSYGNYGAEMDEDDDRYSDLEQSPSLPPSEPRRAKKSLAELYRRPYELMYHADFHRTKVHAARLDRWLLLNLQSSGEFTSQLHNRDLWANEVIGQVVKENFVFSLLEETAADDECSKVCCFYKLEGQLPAVLVIDPITGQMLAKWSGAIQPDDFLGNVEEYCRSKPSMRSKPAVFRRPSMPETSASAGEPDEQKEPAMAEASAPMDEHKDEPTAAPTGACSGQEPEPPAPEVVKIEAPSVAVQEDDQPMEGEKMYRVRVRFPDGSVTTKEFGCKRRVAKLYAYCRSVLHEQVEGKPQAFQIKRLTDGVFHELPEGDASFEDFGLNRATVSVVLDS